MARKREGVLLFSRNPVAACDALGGQSHGQQRGRVMLSHIRIGAWLEAAEGKHAHRFHAARDHNPVAAGPDALICNRNRLQPEEQSRLTVAPGISTGRPARRIAQRAMSHACSPQAERSRG